MALQVFNPPVRPSSGTKNKPEFKIKTVEFGDGYTQATRQGLNHIRRVLTLTWDFLLPDQADAIEAFLYNHGGDIPFLYAPADTTQQFRWTCQDYDRSYGTPNTVSATFKQDFNFGG